MFSSVRCRVEEATTDRDGLGVRFLLVLGPVQVRYKEGPGRVNRVDGSRVEEGRQAGSWPMVRRLATDGPLACSNTVCWRRPDGSGPGSSPATGAVWAVAASHLCNSPARFDADQFIFS